MNSNTNSVKIKLRNFVIYLLQLLLYLEYSNGFKYWRRLGPLPADMALGTSCKSSLQCLLFIPHSHCDWDERVCTCQPYHIEYMNNTMCLPASLLGFGCSVNEQCTLKVPNSQCVDGVCKCKPNFTPIRRDKCLPPAKMEDYCLNNEMCSMGGEYTYCKWIIPRIYGKCKCPQNYQISKDGQCMPVLDSKCLQDEHCLKMTPNSECSVTAFSREPTCVCKNGYKATIGNKSCEEIVITTTTTTTTTTTSTINALAIDASEENMTSINVVSLGKACNSSLECRIRDPFSTCLNGICECIDRTSECSVANKGCYNDTFQCRNGKCISWYFVCDKTVHCDDGSDEDVCKNFDCPKEAFQCGDGTCLSRGSVCNGRWECPDGSDEAQCYRGIKCNSRLHQCKSGQCLPQHTFCNTITECLDASDENPDVCENAVTCPKGTYQCGNNKCRSTAILCSGVDGCGDNSDEEMCEVCYCKNPLKS